MRSVARAPGVSLNLRLGRDCPSSRVRRTPPRRGAGIRHKKTALTRNGAAFFRSMMSALFRRLDFYADPWLPLHCDGRSFKFLVCLGSVHVAKEASGAKFDFGPVCQNHGDILGLVYSEDATHGRYSHQIVGLANPDVHIGANV